MNSFWASHEQIGNVHQTFSSDRDMDFANVSLVVVIRGIIKLFAEGKGTKAKLFSFDKFSFFITIS